MKIRFSSLKCGLLAIYFIEFSKASPFKSLPSSGLALLSIALAVLCFLIPFDFNKKDEGWELE